MQGSLLDLSDSDLEPFDYINCSGVLHHLHNPAAGLQALKAILKNDGAMGLMLYGKHGRTGIYHMQELMQLVNRNEFNSEAKIANTREVLDLLPETNWYKKAGKLYAVDGKQGDEEIYDLFLHSSDHPFTVPEIYDLLEGAGLKLVEFLPCSRALYDPRMAFRDAGILKTVLQLPHSDQQGAAELYWGTIKQHEFWASAGSHTVADFNNEQNVPFFSRVSELKKIPELLKNHTDDQWSMNVECSGSIMLHLSLEYSATARRFVALIDGQRTLGEIRQALESESPSDLSAEDIHETCRCIFETLRSYDLILLRHQSVPAFRTSY
jgi:SAM-dependent methyltransferase